MVSTCPLVVYSVISRAYSRDRSEVDEEGKVEATQMGKAYTQGLVATLRLHHLCSPQLRALGPNSTQWSRSLRCAMQHTDLSSFSPVTSRALIFQRRRDGLGPRKWQLWLHVNGQGVGVDRTL